MGGDNSKHEYEQDTIRIQNEQVHKQQMEEIANQKWERQQQLQQERQKAKDEHERELKKLNNELEEKRLQHKRELEKLKQKQKEQAIKGLKSKISDCESIIRQCQNKLSKLNGILQSYNKDMEEIKRRKDKFPEKRRNTIANFKGSTHYDDILSKLNEAKKKIKEDIEKTSLLECNVGKFLHLTQGLVNITTSNQVNAIKLSAIISVFGDVLERETQPSLSIESYFKLKKLDRLVPTLHEETYELLEDLIFKDDDEGKEEYDELVDLINQSLDKPLKRLELRKFKNICFDSENSWKKENDDKKKLTKKSLNKMAPVLGGFFNSMYETMKLTDKILSVAPTLNGEQQIALEDYQNYKIKHQNMNLKQIKNISENNSHDNDDDSNKNTSDELKLEEEQEEEEKDIEENTDTKLLNELNENEQNIKNLQLEKTLPKQVVTQTQMLTEAAIVSIHVIQGMKKEFEAIEDDRAINLAIGIQDSCMKIVRSQGQIRQSLILAQKILGLKPGKLSGTSEKLWGAVDTGVIQIYQSVLKLTETSSKFFNFFLKFNNSFNRFIVAQKENCSLFLSSEYLLKDVKDFQIFSKTLEKDIKLLGDEALKVIKECIQNGAGAELFEEAQRQRNKYQKTFDELQEKLVKLELELDMEEDQIYKDFYSQQAKINTCNFEISMANQNKTVYDNLRKRCEDEILRINN